jgi:VWFA-related protein
MSHRLSAFLLVLAAVLLVPAGSLVAQDAPAAAPPPAAPQQPTFRSRVDSVVVDVNVTDRRGNPVTDLTTADFEVRESGKPQTIETFQLVQTDDGRTDPAAQRDILSMEDQRRETARTANRLFVIYLDDYHVRFGNSVGVRDALARFVAGLSPHDLVALIAPLQPPSALTFTRNHDGILNDIRSFQGRKYDYTPHNDLEARYAAYPPAVQEQMRNDWVVSDLRHLCDYMATLREGRKTLLYVSEGMNGSLPLGVATTGTFASGLPTASPILPGSALDRQTTMDAATLLSDMTTVFSSAARSNTSIYTIDPRGLAESDFNVADAVSIRDDRRSIDEAVDLLRTTAEETGGRAIVGSNNPLPALQQMVRDNSTYYLLGYISSLAPRDGKFHEIEVRVKRKDVEVRARKGYWATTAEDIARASAPAPEGPSGAVVAALDSVATAVESERRQAVTLWTGAARGPAEKALVTLAWEVNHDVPATSGDRVDHVVVTATTASGETLFTGPVARAESAGRVSGETTFEAPAGEVHFKVEVQNPAGRRVETDETSLQVPDFTAATTQITTPFLFAGRTARDIQLVRTTPNPVPAVVRSFARTERVLVRFGAFGPGGTTPTIAMNLLNQNGATIAPLPAPVRTDSGLFESELGLGGVPPGDYVIEIAADTNGTVAKALVGIRVTG